MRFIKFICLVSLLGLVLSCAQEQTLTVTSEPMYDGVMVYTDASGEWLNDNSQNSAVIGDGVNDIDHSKIFMSFDIAGIPDDAQIVSATLRMYQNDQFSGNSYDASGLGQVRVDLVTFSSFPASGDFLTTIQANIGTLATSYSANTWHEMDVTAQLIAGISGPRIQFCIRHAADTSANATADTDGWVMGDAATNKPELVIVYKI